MSMEYIKNSKELEDAISKMISDVLTGRGDSSIIAKKLVCELSSIVKMIRKLGSRPSQVDDSLDSERLSSFAKMINRSSYNWVKDIQLSTKCFLNDYFLEGIEWGAFDESKRREIDKIIGEIYNFIIKTTGFVEN